jgi:RNA polymerase sigma factor (sigma-70 family)
MSRGDGAGVVRFIRDAAGAWADGPPDAELVRLFAATGDPQAFRTLFARHGPVVWAVCRRMLRSHHDVEDAFQATFLVLARGAGGIRTTAAVGGWLCGVAARVAGRVRSARRPEQAEPEPIAGHPDGALGELTVREAEEALYEELGRLPEHYRAALVLCCLEGLTRDEAAARLGWSANKVKNCLEQGRERLRARLTRRGIALGLPLLTTLLAPPAAAAPPPLEEAVIPYAVGATQPPAAILSLANGVTRTMWIAKWKWAVVGCAALVLVTGGALAAVLHDTPVAQPNAATTGSAVQPPKAAPEPKKEPLPPWDIAAEYLRLIIDGKGDQALKMGDKLGERHVKEIQTAGLKRVKVTMILMNDSRVMVVTQREKLKRAPNADAEDAHVSVTLERKQPDAPWVVEDSDVADEGKLVRGMDRYLDGGFDFKPDPKKDKPEPKKEPTQPKQVWDVAVEFLKLALAEKTAEALKLALPGTVSEKKVGEIKKVGFTSTKPVLVLLNDTRIEVAFEQQKDDRGDAGHLVLMLQKSSDGAWLVKDIDFRNEEELEPRVQLYLGGRYDSKPE